MATRGKKPLVYPNCIPDDDKARKVAEMVGVREK
jgi:hypothetical protein